MSESCETCRFWQEISGGTNGLCRRYPPQVNIFAIVEFAGEFDPKHPETPTGYKTLDEAAHDYHYLHPATDESNWCGEWRRIKGQIKGQIKQ